MASEKATTYMQLAAKKVKQLLRNREHRTSWQSRDPVQNRFGGAIRLLNRSIISFAGLPEKWDEALMLKFAIRVGWINTLQAKTWAAEATAPCLEQLLRIG